MEGIVAFGARPAREVKTGGDCWVRTSKVAHRVRPDHDRSHPVHVTLRVRRDVPRLRKGRVYAALRCAFRGGRDRFGFRLIHYSVQADHLHLLCEAEDRRALSRGMQGLAIRMAKRINRTMARRGSVFADRYRARDLTTPTDTSQALRQVLLHPLRLGLRPYGPDPYSSGPSFDGWQHVVRDMHAFASFDPSTVVRPRSWLLVIGWRWADAMAHPPTAPPLRMAA